MGLASFSPQNGGLPYSIGLPNHRRRVVPKIWHLDVARNLGRRESGSLPQERRSDWLPARSFLLPAELQQPTSVRPFAQPPELLDPRIGVRVHTLRHGHKPRPSTTD